MAPPTDRVYARNMTYFRGRRLLTTIAFGLAFVINPAFLLSCDSDEEFEYGEAEMLELLDELNAIETWEADGREMELHLEQSTGEALTRGAPDIDILMSAEACGNRTFVKSASACVSTTEMPVQGTIIVRDLDSGDEIANDQQVQGSFIVRIWMAASMSFLLTSNRIYRSGVSMQESRSIFRRGKSTGEQDWVGLRDHSGSRGRT